VRRSLPSLLLFVALGGAGLAVGRRADHAAWSALVLHAEPLLLVLGAWLVFLAGTFGRRGLAVAILAGGVVAMVGVRLPYALPEVAASPPEWTSTVQRCVGGLHAPRSGVRLLQWTLDGVTDPAPVIAVAELTKPDVVVLQHLADPALAEAVLQVVGGESRMHAPEGGGEGVAVIARGGFHPCGEALEWSEAMDSPYGYTVHFVGVPPDTVVPLLVTRLPGILDGGGWSERMATATARVSGAIAGLQSPSMVVVADAAAPRTYRYLDAQMAALGLGTVPVPPSWPARWGGLPLLTLHPYDRVWAGVAWRVEAARRVDATVGTRAPILTVLAPAQAEAMSP
jgi:hypothetical protein